MACRTSFLSRQSDVIASFSFGAWLCTRKILLCQIICFLHRTFYFSDILSTYLFCINNMASPGQRRGKCGHAMALFDTHTHCARCREKGKGQDFCVENPTSADKCPFYCVNISYLVDQCICPARSRSRQTLDKNVLSWALTGTGSVLLIRQVS